MRKILALLSLSLMLCVSVFLASNKTSSAGVYGCNLGSTKHAHLVSGNLVADCLTTACHKTGQHTSGHQSGTLPLPPPANITYTNNWDYVMLGDIVPNLPSCPAVVSNGTFQ